ncbi:MAG: DUF4013 domain-containing protein [Halopenitus sp.]
MLREALATPGRGSAAAATAVVGSALLVASAVAVGLWAGATAVDPRLGLLVPLVLVPYLLLRGYGVRVVASGLRRDPAAPTFSRPGVLLRDGVKSTVLSLLLLLPLWVILLVGGGAAGVLRLGRVDAAGVGTELSAVVAGFTAVVALGWLACYAYLRPAALACFADDGRLRDGLHPGRVLRVALDGDYLKGWALGTLVLATGILVALPFVPLLVGIPLAFGVTVATNSLYGRGAAGALRGTTPNATAAEPKSVGVIEPTPEPESVSEPEPAPEPEPVPEPEPTPEPEASSTPTEDLPPGSDEFLAASEPDPAVQTGRRVPLTATDILSKSVRSGGESGGKSEAAEATESDASDRAAGVDDSGELVDEPREPEATRRREEPDETGFAWGATESSEGKGGGAEDDQDGDEGGDDDRAPDDRTADDR